MVMEVHALVNGSLIGYILGVQEKWLWFGRGAMVTQLRPWVGSRMQGVDCVFTVVWCFCGYWLPPKSRGARRLVPALRNLIAQCPQ